MIKRLLVSVVSAVLAVTLLSGIALAAWELLFPINVVDTSGTIRTYYPVMLGFGAQTLVDAGKITSNGTDTNMQIGGGNISYMMSTTNVTAVIPTLSAGGVSNLSLYTGYSPVQSRFPIITGSGGNVTTPYNAALALGNNFIISASGWFNTDNGTDKNIYYTESSTKIYISPTVSGNSTTEIFTNEGWVSPTGTNDPSSAWTNDANAYDNNTATYAYDAVTASAWTAYLELTHAAITINKIRFYAEKALGGENSIDIDYYSDDWHDIYEGDYAASEWITKALVEPELAEVTKVRVRIYLSAGSGNVVFNELDFGEYDVAASVSVTGVSSGEHTVVTESNGLLGMGIDIPITSHLPITDNLTLNLPFWSTDLSSNTSTSVDVNALTITNSGSTWASASGRTFDGLSDTISCGNDTALNVTGNVTIELWLKIYAYESGAGIMNKGAGTPSIFINQYDAGANRFDMRAYDVDGGVSRWVTSATTPALNTWFHLVFVSIQNADPQGYINGVSNGVVDTTRADKALRTNVSNLLLGSDGVASYSNVTIGEFRIYGRALSLPEITQNYNSTKWKYDGSGDNFSYIFGASVPANTNNTTWMQNDVMPYADNLTITINGTQVLRYAPQVMLTGAIIPDLEGTEDGIISWGSNSNLSILYGEMSSFESYMASISVAEGYDMPTADMPETWFAAGENAADLPFYESFAAVAVQTGRPVQSYYMTAIIAVAFGVFIGLTVFTRSALLGYIAMVGIFGIGSTMTIVPAWIVFTMIIIGAAIMYLYRQVAY